MARHLDSFMESVWTIAVFATGVVAAVLLLGFALSSYFLADFHFWPPEQGKPWQYHVFWILFRIFVLSLVALSILDFHGAVSAPAPAWLGFVGWPLAALGFGAALYLTNFLGWRTAYSVEPEGLRTDGAFTWSRNPIYVVTLVGMVGLGLAVASWWAAILLTLWALFYLLAPVLEEPWLEHTYGSEYLDYKSRTPRFL